MVTWRTERKKLAVQEGYTALKCVVCGQIFIIKNDVPLDQQVNGHTWQGEYMLRHLTKYDYDEAKAESELCLACGVPHGSNPTTSCGIGCVQKDAEGKQ